MTGQPIAAQHLNMSVHRYRYEVKGKPSVCFFKSNNLLVLMTVEILNHNKPSLP